MKIVLVLIPTRPGEKRKFTASPLGLLYLGSYLKNLGHQVTIIDADTKGYTLDELAKKIVAKKADLIGITVMTPFIANVLNLSKKIKILNPKTKICLGGIHITATSQESMEESKYVDFLVVGEGEYTLAELLEALEKKTDFKQIKGLIYRNEENGQIIKNELRPPIEDLDSLPMPDLDLIENLDFKNYDAVYAGGRKIINILGSRGCPFKCTFCAAHLVHGRNVRFRDPKKIVDEIEYNKNKYGVSYVSFKDGTFTVNHKWVKEICQEISNRKLNIGFCVNARIDTITEEILRIMEETGCNSIGFGIESGSQHLLDKMNKNTTIEKIKDVFKIVNKFNFIVTNSFMIGNLGDTKETIEKTYQLAKELKSLTVGFSPLTAFPGTQIYYDALGDNLINPKWYLKRVTDSDDEFVSTGVYDGVLPFKDFTTEEMTKKIHYRFYSRPAYILSVFKKIIQKPILLKYALDYAKGILIKKTFDNT